ncbi:MAG: nucleotide exchange factor GrpE [Candidatus Aminicenantes bacterium]|jgi:molecular chaperone GrpE
MTEQEDRVEISISQGESDDSHDDEDTLHEDEDEKKKAHPAKKTSSKKRVSVKQLQKELKEKEDLLEEIEEERDEYKDKYLRNLAEIDNFRKRVKKEKEDYQRYVLSEFLLDLLQVYDNLERALKAKTPAQKDGSVLTLLVSEDEKSIISGVQMIYKQFSDLLKKYNVVEIDALGKHFDPNIHQALSKEEREGISEPTVIEEYQKGFMYNDKLLKPTLVKVAIPKEEEEEEEEAEEEMDTDADRESQEEEE